MLAGTVPASVTCAGGNRTMRVLIAAVGRLKQGPERELAASYRKRAEATSRTLGFRDFEIVEIRESRAQDMERRRIEESIAIATIIPEGAILVGLHEGGENLDSAALAGLLREWRAEDRPAACLVVGGADAVALLGFFKVENFGAGWRALREQEVHFRGGGETLTCLADGKGQSLLTFGLVCHLPPKLGDVKVPLPGRRIDGRHCLTLAVGSFPAAQPACLSLILPP
jgi:23S rRNA (pseudouridine1915-N3)-methyltransferase